MTGFVLSNGAGKLVFGTDSPPKVRNVGPGTGDVTAPELSSSSYSDDRITATIIERFPSVAHIALVGSGTPTKQQIINGVGGGVVEKTIAGLGLGFNSTTTNWIQSGSEFHIVYEDEGGLLSDIDIITGVDPTNPQIFDITVLTESAPVFSDIAYAQVEGTQFVQLSFRFSGATSGNLYVRPAMSTYGGGGKSEIEGEGGFPEIIPVTGSDEYVFTSSGELSAGTTYEAFFYYSDGVTTVPSGNGVERSGALTIQEVLQGPSDIIPNTINVTQGTASGTVIAQLSADVPDCTFAESSPTTSLAAIASDGTVTLTQTASSTGNTSIGATATNSVGSHAETLTISVAASTGSGDLLPTVNTNTTVTSVGQARTIAQAFASNFSAARTTYGVPTGEPIFGCTFNTTSELNLSNINLSSRITFRGIGTLTRDNFTPTSACKCGDQSFKNSTNIRLMAIQVQQQSNFRGIDWEDATNCTFERCVVDMKAARTLAGLSTDVDIQQGMWIKNTTNCGVSYSAIVGGNFQIITELENGSSTVTGFNYEWNVCDQLQSDNIRIQYTTATNWYFGYNLIGGRFRRPINSHSDFLQVRFGVLSGSTMEYNCCLVGLSYGNDIHAPFQLYWSGTAAGGSNNNTVIQNFHNGPGRIYNPASSSGTTNSNSPMRYNTDLAVSDIPSSYSSGAYSANFACLIGRGIRDYNIVGRQNSGNDNGAGPNGAYATMPNAGPSDVVSASVWDAQLAFVSRSLNRSETIGAIKPPNTSSRAHWDNGNPAGAYLLMEKLFDPVTHEHWKDKGWPIDAQCHIAYDPNNELAGASGTYSTYTSNGQNTG